MRYPMLIVIFSAAAMGQGMTCKRVPMATTIIRSEGLAELTSDVVLSCTGGVPAAAGSALPQYEILAIASVPFANRVVKPPATTAPIDLNALPTPSMLWTDALLTLDDVPARLQTVCAPLTATDACPARGGSSVNPNVFQAKVLQENIVVFQKVSIDPPGEGKARLIRIKNLRVNAQKIPSKPAEPEVQVGVQIFDTKGSQILKDSVQIVAAAKPSYAFSIRTADDAAVSSPSPALTVTPSMISSSNSTRATAFNIKFSELFPGAFRRRNLGTSGADPNLLVSQADPAGSVNTESGLFNANFPDTNNLNTAGLADSGTRFLVTFTNIPENVVLWVSGRDSAIGTTDYSVKAPRALLTYTTASGDGPFSQSFPALQQGPVLGSGFSQVYVDNGTVTVAWEVVSADPDKLEDFSFECRLFGTGPIPHIGTALALGRIGPVYPAKSQTASTVPSQPSFTETLADAVPAFRVVPTLGQSDFVSVSAASYAGASVAPDSLVSGFGKALSNVTEVAGLTPSAKLAGVSVDVIDAVGARRTQSLLLVSPGQINYILDPATRSGQAVVTVNISGQTVATGYLQVLAVAPALFSANGDGHGVPAGVATYGTAAGTRTALLGRYDSKLDSWVAQPLDLSQGDTFLTLYGTGIRGRSRESSVSATIGGQSVPVTFAGAQPQYPGLDQVNIGPLSRSLGGRGEVPLVLTVDGITANTLTIQIQ